EFLLLYGESLLEDGRPAEARPLLARAAQLFPTADVQNALADACEQLGDRQEAASLWRQVVAVDAGNRIAREGLARAALENRSPDEALRWLEPLLSSDDLRSSAAYQAQRAAVMAGDTESAAKWQERHEALRI